LGPGGHLEHAVPTGNVTDWHMIEPDGPEDLPWLPDEP
jgi:hypothetical protein